MIAQLTAPSGYIFPERWRGSVDELFERFNAECGNSPGYTLDVYESAIDDEGLVASLHS